MFRGVSSINTELKTLERMVNVDRYNRWIYHIIQPYLGSRILEVGCGIGTMTQHLLNSRRCVVALDILPEAIAFAKQRYSDFDNLIPLEGDICDELLVEHIRGCNFDTVVCINVLEHIYDECTALKNIHQVLKAEGRLVLYVPAGVYLYGTLDKALGHYRRYNKRQLFKLVGQQGYEIEKLSYMNVAGIVGWYLDGKIRRKKMLSEKMLSLFNSTRENRG